MFVDNYNGLDLIIRVFSLYLEKLSADTRVNGDKGKFADVVREEPGVIGFLQCNFLAM